MRATTASAIQAPTTDKLVGFAQLVTVCYYARFTGARIYSYNLYAEGATATACRLHAKQLQREQLALAGTVSVKLGLELLQVTKPSDCCN